MEKQITWSTINQVMIVRHMDNQRRFVVKRFKNYKEGQNDYRLTKKFSKSIPIGNFEYEGDFCTIMPYYEKGDLFENRMGNHRIILHKILLQLDAIHRAGYVYGDLKLENVLMIDDDEPVLIDFESTRPLNTIKKNGFPKRGTPCYMAPELLNEQPYDKKVDIWAFGILASMFMYDLHPLLRGLPEDNQIDVEFMKTQISNEPYNRHSIVRDCLKLDPKMRPTTTKLLKLYFPETMD